MRRLKEEVVSAIPANHTGPAVDTVSKTPLLTRAKKATQDATKLLQRRKERYNK